jgi:hypothetical protein
MKFKNFLFGATLAVELICFLIIPSVASAEFNLFGFSKEENPQTFSEFQAKNILTQFSKKIYNRWNNLKSNGYSDPRETTTLSFLKQAINYDVWNYIFQDLPIETSIKVGKALAEIIQVIAADDSMKLALEKLERESVKISVDYIKQELFKYNVKTAFGATKVRYDIDGKKIDTSFQYIMAYTPIDDKKGTIVTRIYSPNELEPPNTSASYGLATGTINDLAPGEKIPPFIVEFKGIITNKNFSWYYQWEGEPEIRVYFPDKVPDFGFKSIPWYDKYVINPIKKTVNGVIDTITGFFSKGETVDYINLEESNQPNEEAQQELGEMLNGVNNYEEKKQEEKPKTTETITKQEEEKEETVKQEEKPKQEIIECQLINYNPSRNNILINEVAWMGSKTNANDEWIELKNISSSEINLKNWRLYDKDKQISILIENDLIVSSQGFVLFERTDDNSVSVIKADKIYTGALSNTNEALYLFNSNCGLEDFVEANSSWPAGDSGDRLTMERGNDLSWHDYSGFGYADIFGTPKQENSQEKKKEEKQEIVIKKTSVQKNTGGTYTSGGGDINYCSQSNLNQAPLPLVIINEVAWMGTEYSSSDEWIELKNISEEDINLNGWQLLDKDNQIKIIFNSADIISSNGFYLLERTDETAVLNVLADKIYSNALSDSNESLRLFNSNCELVDQIEASPNWIAGDKDLKKTMERNIDLDGWHTYSLLTLDNPSGLFGTPKKENSGNNQEANNENGSEEPAIITPSSLLITEISLGRDSSNEYVEIFNQTEGNINLCASEENCYYLSYFANTFNEEEKPNHSWDDPSYNWRFPDGLIIAPNQYILIDVFGDGGGDFKAGEYAAQKLSNSSGSLSLFSNNPVYEGEEERTQEENITYAQSLRIDTVAWKTSSQEPEVREGSAFIVNNENILGRKYYLGKYIDSNNNINDIEGQKSSIKTNPSFPPEAVNDLSIISGSKKNSVILSWTAPIDQDTSKEELDYEIYYSLNKEIDAANLIKINDYVEVEIKKQENNISVLISDLYYNSNYYFVVKAKDKELNYSGISNIVNHSILKAEHIKPYYYIDFGMRNRSFLDGPTYDNFQESSIFIKGEDGVDVNDEFSLPIIDENENIYTSGSIDGKKGVFIFDKEGNKKWTYECVAGEKMSLSTDGTLYVFCSGKITALSPSGKLKWQEDIFGLFKQEPILDFNNRIYLISNDINSSLIVIDDEGDRAKINYRDLGKHYDYFSNIVIDQDGNAYFSADNMLFEFNGTSKIEERVVDVVYDEEYVGEKDKMTKITNLSLSLSGIILFNTIESKYDKEGKPHPVLYGLNKDNILSDFLWSIDDIYYGAIGVNEDEFFVQNNPPGSYAWYHLFLYSFDVLTGIENWNKHWSCDGSPVYFGSFVSSDNNNNIYFNQGGEIIGYNSNEILDDNPENDRVFSSLGAGYSSSTAVSLGRGVMYYTDGRIIKKLKFNP